MFDSKYSTHDPHFSMSKRIWTALHPLGWWRNDEMKFFSLWMQNDTYYEYFNKQAYLLVRSILTTK